MRGEVELGVGKPSQGRTSDLLRAELGLPCFAPKEQSASVASLDKGMFARTFQRSG